MPSIQFATAADLLAQRQIFHKNPSKDAYDFYLKLELCVWRDERRDSLRPVRIVWTDGQNGLLPEGKFWHTFIPALDDSPKTDFGCEWFTSTRNGHLTFKAPRDDAM